ncbi:AAA family ATPase [Terasakiella pusilla]|uniref:AAA family ATPase n=1 Tax=Terasakiella pusilla TaxID=64973 RepID=UPI00048B75B1|nr:ATP-binding protein [Terasakiella pusilla]
MEHFAVIQSLCRIGLAGNNDKFRKQVERLRDRLTKGGDEKQAITLEKLLNSAEKEAELVPSKVELSKAKRKKEKLSSVTIPPHDRETSAALADIIMEPTPQSGPPVLHGAIHNAVETMINEWQKTDELVKLGLAPSTSCLIFGPPGTGKTLSAYHIAEKLGLPLVVARIDGLISSFLGTTARNLANIFEFANRYDCVLLLDEFDAIAKLRDDPHEVGEIKRVVNTLLQNLDARAEHGLTIAITNHPELLDTAVWRRFETRLELPPPHISERQTLVEQFLSPVEASDVFKKFMIWLSDGFSGADIKTMSDAVKRHVALSDGDNSPKVLWSAIEAFSTRNAGLDCGKRTNVLLLDRSVVANNLINSEDVKFTQKEIGELLQKDQGTISRWVSGSK